MTINGYSCAMQNYDFYKNFYLVIKAIKQCFKDADLCLPDNAFQFGSHCDLIN